MYDISITLLQMALIFSKLWKELGRVGLEKNECKVLDAVPDTGGGISNSRCKWNFS